MTTVPARLQPRKRPKQARSRETRQRILEAAARVFGRHGYSRGTTNRIAAEAGLSVGSLYQYFPNKDAVLVELVRAHVADGASRVTEVMTRAGFADLALADQLGALVDAAIAAHAGDARLHQVLFEEAPRPPSLLDELHHLESTLVAAAEALLRADPAVRVDDPAVAARLVVTTIESAVHRQLASGRPETDIEPFRSELLAMLTRYLTG